MNIQAFHLSCSNAVLSRSRSRTEYCLLSTLDRQGPEVTAAGGALATPTGTKQRIRTVSFRISAFLWYDCCKERLWTALYSKQRVTFISQFPRRGRYGLQGIECNPIYWILGHSGKHAHCSICIQLQPQRRTLIALRWDQDRLHVNY